MSHTYHHTTPHLNHKRSKREQFLERWETRRNRHKLRKQTQEELVQYHADVEADIEELEQLWADLNESDYEARLEAEYEDQLRRFSSSIDIGPERYFEDWG